MAKRHYLILIKKGKIMKPNKDVIINKLLQQNAQLTFDKAQLESVIEQYQQKAQVEQAEKAEEK